jgi:hypothetical protein
LTPTSRDILERGSFDMHFPKSVLLIPLMLSAWDTFGLGAEPPAAAQAKPDDPATVEAERQKIWNSEPMLRARAWLEDYFTKAAKVTPKEAQEYREHLQAMTPVQMRLWLLKFEEEEQRRKQAEAAWQQARQFELSQNEAALQRQQQALANSGASGAGLQDEQGSQRNLQNQMILQQKYGAPFGYGPYRVYPYGGYPLYGSGPYPYPAFGY